MVTELQANRQRVKLKLDNYQQTNLREGLLVLRALGCDTGDWLGELLNELHENDWSPNVQAHDQVQNVIRTYDRLKECDLFGHPM